MRPHLWMIFAAGVALSACTANEGPPPRIASIDVGSPVDSILNQGASVQFSAIARDSRGQVMTQALTWQSSNPGAAAVSATGVVAALTPGRATIQVTVPSDGGVQGALPIRVVDADLTTITAITADAFGGALLGALSTAARPAAQTSWASCASHAADQNIVAIRQCVTDLRTQAGAVTDGSDRALLATLAVFGDQIERRLAL